MRSPAPVIGSRGVRAAAALLVVTIALTSSAGPAVPASAKGAAFDTVLLGGTVFDGTGRPGRRVDVGVTGGYITAVGDLSHAPARRIVNVTGRYVAPGFIDLHSHALPTALPTAVNSLTQGVTTEILNPDGGYPVYLPGDTRFQLAAYSALGLAINIGTYTGFNTKWDSIVGNKDVDASPAEIASMRKSILKDLSEGAFGVSAGLDYTPASFASTDEVVRVVSVARGWRTNFPNHERLTPETGLRSTVGIAETLEIGKRAGIAPMITHMKIQGHEQGKAPEVLASLRAVTKTGSYAPADVYPYLAGQTGLATLIIPTWAQDGGRSAMLARFKDPAQRKRIVKEAETSMRDRFNGPGGVDVIGVGELTAEMAKRHAGAGETVVEILEASDRNAILTFGVEKDLRRILRYENAAIATDGGAFTNPKHPRYYGTYPRVLGRYVRQLGLLTWPDAIRKMSGLPATIIGLSDRGFLVPGMRADITVFNPRTILDHATYENPTALSTGVEQVFVNGVQALKDGVPTHRHGGRTLRRTTHEPTRPMSVDVNQGVAVRGTITHQGRRAGVSVALSVKQGAREAKASGTFRLEDPRYGLTLDLTDVGLLQSAQNWASFVGIAKVTCTRVSLCALASLTSSRYQPIRVTIDRADPTAPGRVAIDAKVADVYSISGTLNR
jgi:N-acyl-D-amino-acid deacylase